MAERERGGRPAARGARPVSLQDRVQSDIAVAMRGGDGLRRDVLRMVASAAYNVEKKQGKPLTEAAAEIAYSESLHPADGHARRTRSG